MTLILTTHLKELILELSEVFLSKQKHMALCSPQDSSYQSRMTSDL